MAWFLLGTYVFAYAVFDAAEDGVQIAAGVARLLQYLNQGQILLNTLLQFRSIHLVIPKIYIMLTSR